MEQQKKEKEIDYNLATLANRKLSTIYITSFSEVYRLIIFVHTDSFCLIVSCRRAADRRQNCGAFTNE